MSKIFEVVATENNILTFGDVLELSQKKINSLLHLFSFNQPVELSVEIHSPDKNKGIIVPETGQPFCWEANEYCKVNYINNGIKIKIENETLYDKSWEDSDPWWFIDEIKLNNQVIKDIDMHLEKAREVNKLWRFSRYEGSVNLWGISYGLIASAVAELCNGIIYMDDAWRFKLIPGFSYHIDLLYESLKDDEM